ncbi:leucyl aminopeptidase family protein [Algihabitans albus]|uniref:leucyl aminopeptidase family protein n=1 Tax=Algihabitans albus TaxID=2164067 RepID=UPI000E5CB601|nr:leucyl aminopeptidase family protein [Algihabitans albus]
MSESYTVIVNPTASDHLIETADAPVEVVALTKAELESWLTKAEPVESAWVEALGFSADPGKQALLPAADGKLTRVLLGVEEPVDLWAFAGLPEALPEGDYHLAAQSPRALAEAAALGWAVGGYRFRRYKTKDKAPVARLVWPEGVDRAAVTRLAAGVGWVRDLVTTPAEDMGPGDLERSARSLATSYGAQISVISGAQLLESDYPAIHTVGRAAGDGREARLIDLTWTGSQTGPQVTLIGKGVCFDSGGLDLKSPANMKLMKKDMGGAAHALGLAYLIMDAGLPLRLRVLVPAVENAVSGEAFRPLDVLRTRQGLTVEVGDTDAEGRLILCDALAEAGRDRPDLLLDMATLTGAARVALGTDLPALFSNNDDLAAAALAAAAREADPLWRLPLHQPYQRFLESKVADLSSTGSSGFGGAITAALFLERFVPEGAPWIHVDLMAWNTAGRPGRPEGGEAQGLRALYALVQTTVERGSWR